MILDRNSRLFSLSGLKPSSGLFQPVSCPNFLAINVQENIKNLQKWKKNWNRLKNDQNFVPDAVKRIIRSLCTENVYFFKFLRLSFYKGSKFFMEPLEKCSAVASRSKMRTYIPPVGDHQGILLNSSELNCF